MNNSKPGLHSAAARILAGLIALAAWAGIAIHFHALAGGPATWPAALWVMLGYFTITTNLLVALCSAGSRCAA